jgi:hypothetical protein
MSDILRASIDVFGRSRPWTSTAVDGQVVVTWNDGVRASVWLDGAGDFHACELPLDAPAPAG